VGASGGTTTIADMASSLSMDIGGRTLQVTNPDKVVFPDAGVTKLALIEYYLSVADGALRGVAGRPMILKPRRRSSRSGPPRNDRTGSTSQS
jgi:hypothetical protein